MLRLQDDADLKAAPYGYLHNPDEVEPVQSNVFQILNASLSKGFGAMEALKTPIIGNKSLQDIVGSAFHQTNSIGSMLNRDPNLPVFGQKPDLNFDQFSLIPDDKRIYARRYYNANSQGEVDAISRQIDKELDDKNTLSESGWLGVTAGVGAGLLDPINLIPVAGWTGKVKTGGSILKGALTTAGVGLGAMSLSEAALQSSQMTRTFGESATNIGVGTFLSGLFGGVGTAWERAVQAGGQRSFTELVNALDKDLSTPNVGRYTRDEAGQVLEQYAQAETRLLDLKKQNLPKDDPNLSAATRDLEAAKGKWEAVAADVHENDFLAPGGVEVSEDALKRDTGVAAHEADGPVTIGLDELKSGRSKQSKGSGGEKPPTGKATEATPSDSATMDELLKDHGFIEKLPLINQQDPLIRTVLSRSIETRRIIQELAEVPLTYAKNALGVATRVPVEAVIKQSKAPLAFALKHLDEMFEEYRFGEAGRFGKLRAELGDIAGGEGRLTYQEFKQAVGQAMRNGDEHAIPQVAAAARRFREEVFNPLKERAVKIGVLPEDIEPKTALSYLTRVWDVEKIVANRDEFFQRNLKWLKQKEAQTVQAAAKAGEDFTPRTDAQLEDISDRLIDRIKGTPGGRLSYDLLDLNPDAAADSVAGQAKAKASKSTVGRARPLNKRIYDIPDAMVEDFLVNDIEQVAKIYERTMSADLSLMEKFGKPDLDEILEDLKKRIADDYNLKHRTANTSQERKLLEDFKERDMRDIQAVFERLRGTYGLPQDPGATWVIGSRILRTLNYMSLMGGVLLSSIADLGGPILKQGLSRYLIDGWVPVLTNMKAVKLAAQEVQLAGTAWDIVLDSRAMALHEMMDEFGRGGKFDRGLQGLQTNFSQLTGISHWTAAMKQFAGLITQTRLINATLDTAAGTVAKKELNNLAASYIDSGMAKRIAQQFERYGETSGTVRLPNTTRWTDMEAVKVFRAAIAKDVDRTIVTPGMDKPLWMSTEMGKLFMQFKSFAFASTQRVLLAGLQDRDLGVLNGVVVMTGLGMISTLLRDWFANRHKERTPAQWVAEGIDRSGVTGWLFDANNILEKVTRGHVGVGAITGSGQMSRYASRNIADALMGPSVGRVEDALKVTGAVTSGEWSESDTRAIRRLIPFQNLFYIRQLFDAGEDRLQDILGVENRTGEKTE